MKAAIAIIERRCHKSQHDLTMMRHIRWENYRIVSQCLEGTHVNLKLSMKTTFQR
jgi:hypothetical protein